MFSKLFTKILVPYDGSKHSEKALSQAIDAARNLDSEILLLTVVNVAYISPPGMLKGLTRSESEKKAIKKWTETVLSDAEKMLKAALKKCEKKGISASYQVKEGNVSETVLEFAKKKKVTVIIIGSQGLSGIKKIKTLGSVSRKVSELAHCPVLIIR